MARKTADRCSHHCESGKHGHVGKKILEEWALSEQRGTVNEARPSVDTIGKCNK